MLGAPSARSRILKPDIRETVSEMTTKCPTTLNMQILGASQFPGFVPGDSLIGGEFNIHPSSYIKVGVGRADFDPHSDFPELLLPSDVFSVAALLHLASWDWYLASTPRGLRYNGFNGAPNHWTTLK